MTNTSVELRGYRRTNGEGLTDGRKGLMEEEEGEQHKEEAGLCVEWSFSALLAHLSFFRPCSADAISKGTQTHTH